MWLGKKIFGNFLADLAIALLIVVLIVTFIVFTGDASEFIYVDF